jgi:hypothetical protein
LRIDVGNEQNVTIDFRNLHFLQRLEQFRVFY